MVDQFIKNQSVFIYLLKLNLEFRLMMITCFFNYKKCNWKLLKQTYNKENFFYIEIPFLLNYSSSLFDDSLKSD